MKEVSIKTLTFDQKNLFSPRVKVNLIFNIVSPLLPFVYLG